MPDITMCDDKQCPMRNDCFRFKAKPSEYQSYFSESPRKGDECDYFDDIEKYIRKPKVSNGMDLS